MAVYAIGEIRNIIDENKWLEYKSKVKDTLDKYGAKILFRGENIENLAGELAYKEIVVIEFESLQKAKQWFDSKEYQSIIHIRDMGAEVDLNLYS